MYAFGGCGGGATTSTGTTATTSSTSSTATTAGSCFATYVPNYSDAINTSTNPNVEGNFYTWANLPIKIFFVVDSFWSSGLQTATLAGFDSWNSTVGGASYTIVSSSSSADLVVSFVPPGTIGTNVLGVTSGTVRGSQLVSATMEILNTRTLNQITQTAGHEYGHALGMFGHSPSATDIMYYAAAPASPNAPTANDSNTLLGLYCGNFFSRATRASNSQPLRTIRIEN